MRPLDRYLSELDRDEHLPYLGDLIPLVEGHIAAAAAAAQGIEEPARMPAATPAPWVWESLRLGRVWPS